MRNVILLLLTLLCLSSCSTNYYLVASDTPIPLYAIKSPTADMYEIPVGQTFVVSKQTGNYRKANYLSHTSYIVSRNFLKKKKYKTRFFVEPVNEKTYYSTKAGESDYERIAADNPYRSNGSNVIQKSYEGGGSVHVKGYYRKNGTYVQPHTRSAPRRH